MDGQDETVGEEREENNVDGEREEECKDIDSNDYPKSVYHTVN